MRSSPIQRSRLLTITPNYVTLGNTDKSDNKLTISKEEIDALRYGAKKVRYYFFYLYYYHKIEIRSLSGVIIKIRFYSLLGIGNKRNMEMYSEIINVLYDIFFHSITGYYLDLFANNMDFDISGLIFTQSGLKFFGQNKIIPWEEVGTKDYISYYAIFSKKNNYNYKGYKYWDDWNTLIIYAVTRAILNSKQLLEF